MKKYTVVAVLVAVLALAVPALASNPFVDVPLNHWAYDAVKKLSAAGIVVGYPDGTFQGTKPITRYEMAMVIARALAKVDETKASKEDLALLKKLVVEFKDELNALNVKVDKIDKRLATVEKNLSNFRFSGELRVDFVWNSGDWYDALQQNNYQDAFVHRARLWVRKQVDDNVGIAFRFDAHRTVGGTANVVAADRAWADIKLPWDVMMTLGKYLDDWEGALGLYFDNDAVVSDRLWNPVIMLKKDFGIAKGMVYYAYDDGNETAEYAGRLDLYFNDKIRVGLLYLGWITDADRFPLVDNPYLYGIDFTVNFMKGFRVYGQYFNEDLGGAFVIGGESVDNATIYKVGVSIDQSVIGFTSLVAEYFHADKGAFANTRIYGGAPGAGNDWNGVGVFRQDFLQYGYKQGTTDVIWNRALKDDVDILFLRLMQKWSDKVTTIERYYAVDYDTLPDVTAFSVALRYQYTPSTAFEFIYSSADWSENKAGLLDESHFRFRTYITF
ncbi:MAG: S-layer homology domain-containing protein [Synergistetes bacterium]|nr:S-layer homology domain-containing protein [Synergistota bacterium]MDW8191613.1 S-layer homology domain-containing protein [Synergistota bacterium]